MKQYRVFMLLAILLPIISLSDDTEILLRKYSGKIDNNEVNFFLQIEKNTHKIQGGVVALPKDEEMRRVSTDEANGNIIPASPWWDAIELTPELELQIIHNRKITTLTPQCPAQSLCSYIQYENKGGGLMYFPNLQMAILPIYDHLETFVAKNYEEAKKIFKYEDKNQGAFHYFTSTLLFVNDNYMSFENSYHNSGSGFTGGWTDEISTGTLLDIKTKKIFSFENIFKKGKDTFSGPMIPYTLYCKYSTDNNCSSCKKEDGACPKEINITRRDVYDVYTDGIYGYFDGFYYSYYLDGSRPGINVPVNYDYDDPDAEWEYLPGYDFEEKFSIPLKELKPYLKPEWYNYLIGKGELPKF